MPTPSFQILNVTVGPSRTAPRRGPVNIVFAVKGAQGFWNGTQVSELLRNLSVVEFSFFLGYPVLQMAERESCSPRKVLGTDVAAGVSVGGDLSSSSEILD